MATGDAALAAGMDILTGNEDANTLDELINKALDYIAEFAAGVRGIAAGGTGASTAAQALINLGALPSSDVYDGTGSVFSKVPRYDGSGRLVCAAPIANNHAVPLGTFNAGFTNAIMRYGGTIDQGPLYMTALTPVTSSYVAMFRNGDGRVGISPSARRFKKDIKDRAYTAEHLRAIRVVSYRLKASVYGDGWEDAPVDVGVIAEELIDAGLAEFVVFDQDGAALSVHYERLSLVAIGALQDALDRLDSIEARLAALEA
jgi:hypothetical protein